MARTTRIKDIAARLGVSVATVSRALNDKPGVAADVRQRVLALAAGTGVHAPTRRRAASTGHTPGPSPLWSIRSRSLRPATRSTTSLCTAWSARLAQEGYHVILTTVGRPR